jgi:hypothetical protein
VRRSIGAAVVVVAATLALLGAASRLPRAPGPSAAVAAGSLHFDVDFATGAWSLNGIPFRVDAGGSGHFERDIRPVLPKSAHCNPATSDAPVDRNGVISWNPANYFLVIWFGGRPGTGCDRLSQQITHVLASPRPDDATTAIAVTSDLGDFRLGDRVSALPAAVSKGLQRVDAGLERTYWVSRVLARGSCQVITILTSDQGLIGQIQVALIPPARWAVYGCR